MRTHYVDEAGRKWAVDLPEGASPEDASMGVHVGPPSLASLNLPEELEIRLHNQLFARSLFTARDVHKRRMDIMGALQAALRVDAGRIVQLYTLGDNVDSSKARRNGRVKTSKRKVTRR